MINMKILLGTLMIIFLVQQEQEIRTSVVSISTITGQPVDPLKWTDMQFKTWACRLMISMTS